LATTQYPTAAKSPTNSSFAVGIVVSPSIDH
jgi:hypothetical protein